MNQYYTLDVVKKLIGEIKPIGETEYDTDARINLKEQIEVVTNMLEEIIQVAYVKDSREYSVSECGKLAHKFLINYVKAEIDDYVAGL